MHPYCVWRTAMTTHSGSPREPGCLLGGYTLRYVQAVPFCVRACHSSLSHHQNKRCLTAGDTEFARGRHPSCALTVCLLLQECKRFYLPSQLFTLECWDKAKWTALWVSSTVYLLCPLWCMAEDLQTTTPLSLSLSLSLQKQLSRLICSVRTGHLDARSPQGQHQSWTSSFPNSLSVIPVFLFFHFVFL